MKVKVTVNLGNYQNIGIESSEFDTVKECYNEIRYALVIIQEPTTNDFIKRYIDKALMYEGFGSKEIEDDTLKGK